MGFSAEQSQPAEAGWVPDKELTGSAGELAGMEHPMSMDTVKPEFKNHFGNLNGN